MLHVGRVARFCALIGISLALVACGKSKNASLPTPSGRFVTETTGYSPVVMVILPGGSSLCTGTIVAVRAVLTAAHCALSSGRYQVVTDNGSFSTYDVYYTGQGNVNSTDDLAILVFDEEIADADSIYAIANSVSEGDEVRLVGYGCNDIEDRTGAGTKRTGTNVISNVADYIEFVTPKDSSYGVISGTRGIIGAENRAGSCFGDSGGPALKQSGSTYKIVGVTHAGGVTSESYISEYVNVATNSSNRTWLRSINTQENLGIAGL